MAEQLADVFDVQIQFPLDLRTVKPDLNARNAIGTFQRYVGLAVWVLSEAKLYRLVGGITNDDWVDQTPTNAGLQSVTVSASNPTGGNPGDIHFKNVEDGTEVWYNNAGTWGSVGSIPTGGGSAPDLQAVTDEGNSTTNDINTSGTMQANAFNGVNATLTGVAQTNDLEISGTATWPSSPTDPAHLANKAYVDQSISGASPTYTQDQDVPNTGALSYLNSEYPDASAGDQVYKVASGMRRTWTCYASGAWSRIDEVIET